MSFQGLITAIVLLCLTDGLPFCAALDAPRPAVAAASHHRRSHHHGHGSERHKRSQNSTTLEGVKVKNIRSQLNEVENQLIVKSKWEESLVSAPYAVYAIGQLILLASGRDFDLYRSSNHTYQELRYWRFQPALIQLSHYVWCSFNAAQSNTDRVRHLMLDILSNMKKVIRILVTGNAKNIARFLPIPLELMKDAVDESIALTTETEKSFINTRILLQNISESLSATDSYNDQRLIEVRKKMELLKREKEMLDKLRDNMKESGFTYLFSSGSRKKRSSGDSSGGSSPSIEGQVNQKIAQMKAFKMSENLVEQLNIFVAQCDTWLAKLEKGFDSEDLSKIRNNLADYLDTLIIASRSVQENLRSLPLSNFWDPVINLFQSAIEVLSNFKSGIEGNVHEIKKFIRDNKSELGHVIASAKKFASLEAHVTGSTSVRGSPIPGGAAVESNERFVAAQRQSVLLSTQKRYDEYFRDVERLNAEVNQVILNLVSLNIEEVDIQKIQDMIQKAMMKMTHLQKLWNKLIEFFQLLANSVQFSLKDGVNRFTRFANRTGAGIIEDGGGKASQVMAKEFMLSNALRVATVAKSVNSVTSAYVNASKLYVMPQISGISGLQALDSAERLVMKDILIERTETAKTNIFAIAMRSRAKFDGLVQKQLEEIQTILQITGQPTEEDQAALTAAAEATDYLI